MTTPILQLSLLHPQYSFSFLLRDSKTFYGYQLVWAYQAVVGLGSSFPIEARQDIPVRGKVSKDRNQNQTALLLMLDGDQAVHLLHMWEGGLGLSYACSLLVVGLYEPHVPWSVDPVGFHMVSRTSPASLIFPPPPS